MTQTELTKEEKVDAAVAIVADHAQAALDGEEQANEYVEAYAVATHLEERGVLARQVTDRQSSNVDRARKRLDGQAKRLLDEAVAQGRILAFSSRDHRLLPRLNGNPRGLYGNAVGYTTPALYERAQAAVAQARAEAQAAEETMEALLQQARAAGLPEPTNSHPTRVTYDVDGLRALIALVTS